MEKQNTPLMDSIKRKRERLNWIKHRRRETGDDHLYLNNEFELLEQIQADEKLLATEREVIEKAYISGVKMGESFIPMHGYDNYVSSDEYFAQTFKTGEDE